MLTKTLSRRHIAHAIAYIMGWGLEVGVVDPREPLVVQGDAEVFDRFGRDSCDYASPHWAFVLCFAEVIKPAQAREIFDVFVDAVLPGRRPGQFATFAALHTEPGKVIGEHRSAIHGCIGHVDLFRGRRIQPYWDARDRRRVECFQELVNLSTWAGGPFTSPKDQSCARAVTATTTPRSMARVAKAEFFAELLASQSDDEMLDEAKVSSTLRAAGVDDVDFAARPGRLSVGFRTGAPDGGDMPVRLVIAPRRGHALLTRSSLLPVLGEHFVRSSQTFEFLRAAFLTEVGIGYNELERRHGADPSGLQRLFDWAHRLEFADPTKLPETAETMTKIAVIPAPQIATTPAGSRRLTELLAIQPLLPPRITGAHGALPPSGSTLRLNPKLPAASPSSETPQELDSRFRP